MMDDVAKSQPQLMAELEALRRRVRELEARELEPRPEHSEAGQQKIDLEPIQLLEQTQKMLAKTELLYQTARSFIALKSLPELLQLVVDHVAETVSADRVRLVLVDLPAQRVTDLVDGGPWTVRFPTPQIDDSLFDLLWNGLVGWTLREGRPVLSPKGSLDPRESPEIQQRRVKFEVGSVMVVPIEYHHKIQGVMGAIKHRDKPDFTPEDLELMVAVANHAALAIENSRLFQLLQDSEARYRAVVEDQTELICRFLADGTLTFINEAYHRYVGLTRAEILEQGFFSSVFQADRAMVKARFKALQQGKTVALLEHRLVRSDGEVRWLQWHHRAILNEQGQLLEFQGVGRDITEHKQMEDTLAQERNLLRTLIDNLPDYIYVKDCDSRFRLSNKASFTSLGASTQAELIGKTDFDLFPPEVARSFFEDEQKLFQTGQAIIDKEELGRDTHWNNRWLLTTKVPLRDQQAQIVGLVGISRDVTEAKLAREAEAISRELLQRLIDQLPIGVEIFDLQGITIGMNQALVDIFGIGEPEQVIGHFNLFTDLLAEETGTQAAGLEALAGRSVHLPEVFFDFSRADRRFNQAEGHRTLSVTFFPIRNAQNEVVQIVALNEDITDRKQAEKALRDSEERYRRLVELSPDGIIIHTEGRIKFINPAGVKLHGAQDMAEVIGRSIFDFIPPAYHGIVRQRHQQALKRQKQAPSTEQKIYRLDGLLTDIEVTSIPTSYRGQPALQTIMRDITERKHLQLELARFRSMMDQSGEGIFVVDPQTSRFIDVNETACRLLGYTREELCQLTSMDIVLEENYTLAKWQQRAEQIKQAQSPLRLPRMYIHKDGTTFPVEVIVSHRNFEGQDYILAIARDRREQARLETQLRQAQKMEAVGQLAAGVAHNFNNMLTAIMGYVGLALESLPDDHPVLADLDGVQKTAQRAANLTQQLLAFTRNQIIQPRPLNLNELVINMNRLLRQLISETIELEISPAPGLGLVKIDPGQFEQVLVNLVVNARDAMSEGGRLTIATANVTLGQVDSHQNIDIISGDYVRLSVTDTGSGMAPEVKEHIFEPFFTTKEVGKGTGLGLATCFGIVKQNHGYIIVHSEPGQGATFEIYLPRLKTEITPVLSADEASYPLKGTETILLVEDEVTVREMISRALHRHGYTILEAARGQDAIQLVASLPGLKIHLLITDVVMPGLNGSELASYLKPLYPSLKTLFISGYTDNIIAPHGVLEPGVDFLPKPFTPLVLAQKVRQILDNQ